MHIYNHNQNEEKIFSHTECPIKNAPLCLLKQAKVGHLFIMGHSVIFLFRHMRYM